MPDINLLLNLLTQFAWLGNWLFFTLAFVESAPFIGVFIPGATLISIGGFLASGGYLNAWSIVFFATLGAIVGDFFSYSLGRWGGKWINNKKIINQKILDHGERFFQKYGNISVFWGRFFGPIRAIIPFIAGVSKMKSGPFIFWNVLSGIGWAILNVFLGYFSGSLVVSIFKKWSSGLTLILVAVTVIVLVYWLIKKRGESLVSSFRVSSLNFAKYLHSKSWFKKLISRFTFITDFFNERKALRQCPHLFIPNYNLSSLNNSGCVLKIDIFLKKIYQFLWGWGWISNRVSRKIHVNVNAWAITCWRSLTMCIPPITGTHNNKDNNNE